MTVDADCVLTMIEGNGVTVTEMTGPETDNDAVDDRDEVAKQYGLLEPLLETQPQLGRVAVVVAGQDL